MAITISGENNNDRILAQDGVIDQISGINIVGLITASHIDVGSNINLGNAGIVTATTFVGNLTGNVNSTSPLLLQTGGGERFRITGNNELGIAGANYGSAGQVLTSGGSGSAVTWSAIPTQVTISSNANNRIITGGSGTNLVGESTLTYDNPNLEINTDTSPYAALVLNGNTGGLIQFEDNETSKWQIFGATDLNFYDDVNNASRLRINSSGAVMIGTSAAPSGANTKLRVHFPQNTSSGEAIEISHNTNGADKVGAAFGLAIGNGGESTNAADLIVRTANNGSTSEKLRITSTGNTLVAHSAAAVTDAYAGNALEVGGSTYAKIALTSGTNTLRADWLWDDANVYFRTSTASNLFLGTDNTPRIKIANNSAATTIGGNLTFNAMLTVQGDLSGAIFQLKAAENTTRMMVSGLDTTDCEVNLYDKNGAQRGILVGGETEFAIKAPNSSAPMKFYTHTGSSMIERLRISNDGTVSKYHNSTVQAAFGGTGQINGITATPSMAGVPFVVGRDTGSLRSAHFAGHLRFDSGYGLQGTEFQVYGNTSGLYLKSLVSGDNIIFETNDGSSISERLRITGGAAEQATLVIDNAQTNGNTWIGDNYTASATEHTCTIGNMYSGAGFFAGYGLKPKSDGWGFVSSTDAYGDRRSAITLNGSGYDAFRIDATNNSNTHTTGADVTTNKVFAVDHGGNVTMNQNGGYLKAHINHSAGNDGTVARGRLKTWYPSDLSPSIGGSSSGWYPIMDISDGQYMFLIGTSAHNSATCLVCNGYDPSAVSRINVLNSVRNNNGNYLNINKIRVLNNGVVEVYLYAGNPLYFQMWVQVLSDREMPTFYTTLTKNTGSPTVDDEKDFYAYSSSVGTGLMHVEALRVDGALSKGSGSFTIPHPLASKKDTHHLSHSFIEGPQCDNIYRGKVTLSSGTATVNLDTTSNMTEGTFVLLNRDVQCFTTNETGWGAIKGSVSGNILTISAQDGSSTDTISWMVVGERQDDTIKASHLTDDDGNLIVERDVSSHDDDLNDSTPPS